MAKRFKDSEPPRVKVTCKMTPSQKSIDRDRVNRMKIFMRTLTLLEAINKHRANCDPAVLNLADGLRALIDQNCAMNFCAQEGYADL
jgi:hypothetical protein